MAVMRQRPIVFRWALMKGRSRLWLPPCSAVYQGSDPQREAAMRRDPCRVAAEYRMWHVASLAAAVVTRPPAPQTADPALRPHQPGG